MIEWRVWAKMFIMMLLLESILTYKIHKNINHEKRLMYDSLPPPPPSWTLRFQHKTLLIYWKNQSIFLRIHEAILRKLFLFWKMQKQNNQPIDIRRSKRFFQCLISRSMEFTSIGRSSIKKIFFLSTIFWYILNMRYEDCYYKQCYIFYHEIWITCWTLWIRWK